jgi:hypothetical protein
MSDLFVLVHAPVLGPTSWQPTAAALTGAGHQVTVPSLLGFADGGPPYVPRLITSFAEQAAPAVSGAARVVLVVHSGAGPLAAMLASVLAVPKVTVVFADAGLPATSGPTPVVDAQFLPRLQDLARDGIVPPWPQWWPDADAADLFPGPDNARAAAASEARPLPLAFFTEAVPPAMRPLGPAAYLLLSEGYQGEADLARGRGWPVAELPGSHLHMLADPAGVARAIAALVGSAVANGGTADGGVPDGGVPDGGVAAGR